VIKSEGAIGFKQALEGIRASRAVAENPIRDGLPPSAAAELVRRPHSNHPFCKEPPRGQ
jgi:hypothetical protein